MGHLLVLSCDPDIESNPGQYERNVQPGEGTRTEVEEVEAWG
jgi:hypothetical protein